MSNRADRWCTCEMCEQHPRSAESAEHKKTNRLVAGLDEKQARRLVGLLAEMHGHGGIVRFAMITGMSRTTLTEQLHQLLEGVTAGDPMSAVKWCRKSTRSVSRVLRVSHTKAWKMLRREKYKMRFNRKRLARRGSPHRDQQFKQINRLKKSFALRGQEEEEQTGEPSEPLGG